MTDRLNDMNKFSPETIREFVKMLVRIHGADTAEAIHHVIDLHLAALDELETQEAA